jgi:hypothetical protein
MGEGEEAWASKASPITLLNIEWKERNHGSLVELLNTLLIKGSKKHFGREGSIMS